MNRLAQRRRLFVPLWGIVTWFLYAPRRVECAQHGVVVEQIPRNEGKRPVTVAMMGFLARWARRLSWREAAGAFQTSWECVYRAVEWFGGGVWRTASSKAWGLLGWMNCTGARASERVLVFHPTAQAGDLSNLEPLRIGNHSNPNLRCFFKGAITGVALPRRVLSAEQISASYRAGRLSGCGCALHGLNLCRAFLFFPWRMTPTTCCF